MSDAEAIQDAVDRAALTLERADATARGGAGDQDLIRLMAEAFEALARIPDQEVRTWAVTLYRDALQRLLDRVNGGAAELSASREFREHFDKHQREDLERRVARRS